MRSRFADKFNHDAEAPGYDRDVLNEQEPVREGYARVLDWVAAEAGGARSVVELGTGTGNLALRLRGCRRLVCVDVSREMLRIARSKLSGMNRVQFVEADILEYFDHPAGPCDAVVSTYAVHHLTEDEKTRLFREAAAALRREGRAVFGDLMFENDDHRKRYLAELRGSGREELADEIEDEFFWNMEHAVDALASVGFQVAAERFSALSWGISARKT